jgi:hypothetical protein
MGSTILITALALRRDVLSCKDGAEATRFNRLVVDSAVIKAFQPCDPKICGWPQMASTPFI